MEWKYSRMVCAVAVTMVCAWTADAHAAQSKKPLPTEAEMVEIEKTIRDVYQDEYAKRGPDERRALARKLLDDARGTKDGPTQFGMLQESRNIAQQIGDYDIAIGAADVLGSTFETVDGYDLKMKSLTTIRTAVKTGESYLEGLTAAEVVADQAIGDENFDATQRALEQVIQFAQLTKNLQKIADTRKRIEDVRAQATAYNQMKAAEEQLKADPELAVAKYQVGSYLCLYKGDWDNGLKLTRDGADGAWANVSKQDLLNPVTPAEMMKVADLWYEIGANRSTQKGRVWHRAEFWYLHVLPKVDGIQRTRVEKQLENIARDKVPILGTVSEATRKALPTDAELKRIRELAAAAKAGGTAGATRTTELLQFVRTLTQRLQNGLMEYKETDFTERCKADLKIRETMEKAGMGNVNSAYTFLHNNFVTFSSKSPSREDLMLRIVSFERYNNAEKAIPPDKFDQVIEQAVRNYVQSRTTEYKNAQTRMELCDYLKDKGVRSKGVENYRKTLTK